MSYQNGVGQRTAVVTGAAAPRGIGFATARRYAREGWAVAVLDIDGPGAEKAAAALHDEFSVPTVGVRTDVTDEVSVADAVTAVSDAGLPPVGALATIGRTCPVCATPEMAAVDDVVEEAIELALAQGVKVHLCEGNADLDVLGRIGALLRY